MDVSSTRKIFEKAYELFVQETYSGSDSLALGCKYALEGPGKRVRPMLVLLACQACGGNAESAIVPAIATEMIHTYSLVHDDLPSMDNDDLRRGRPTVHKTFDEATAILVGDALLTDTWSLLAGSLRGAWFQAKNAVGDAETLSMIKTLAAASGSTGMVLGQVLDIYWTGRGGCSFEDLRRIHENKTGALIAAALALGGYAACAKISELNALKSAGEKIGLAFQVLDDILDDSDQTGKSQGKDAEQGKITYVSILGRKEATKMAKSYTIEAIKQLETFCKKSGLLIDYVRFLLTRQS